MGASGITTTPRAAPKPPQASAAMPPTIQRVRLPPASEAKPQLGRVIWMP